MSTVLFRVSSSKLSFVEFDRFFVGPQSLRILESTAPASKNRRSARCAARPAAHATAPRKMTKIHPGIDHFECIWPQGGIGFRCFESIRQSNDVGFDSFGRMASKRRFQAPAREAPGPLSVPSNPESPRRSEALCRSICIDTRNEAWPRRCKYIVADRAMQARR